MQYASLSIAMLALFMFCVVLFLLNKNKAYLTCMSSFNYTNVCFNTDKK